MVKIIKKIQAKQLYLKIGAGLWVANIQYFIIQIIVILYWQVPFSWGRNTISDLGNTICQPYDGRQVCSPHYMLMNFSFVLLGLTMIGGSLVLYISLDKTRVTLVSFMLIAIAGIGTIMVGLFPENTVSHLHVLGASLPFILGNLGLLGLAKSLQMNKTLRIYTYASGMVALIALLLFITKTYLGLGEGGMERIVAYPQTIWMIVYGFYLINKHRWFFY